MELDSVLGTFAGRFISPGTDYKMAYIILKRQKFAPLYLYIDIGRTTGI